MTLQAPRPARPSAHRGTCALLAGAVHLRTPGPKSTSQAGVRRKGGSEGRRGKGARPVTPHGFAAGIPVGRIPVSTADLRTLILADLPGRGQRGVLVPEAPRASRSQVQWEPASLFLALEHSSVPHSSNPTFKICYWHLCLLSFTNFLFQTSSIIFPLLPLLNK